MAIKPKFLTCDEASAYLAEVWGAKYSGNTLRVFASTPGRGPELVKVGASTRYRTKDLDAWVRSITRPPTKRPWTGAAAKAIPVPRRPRHTTEAAA